MAPAPIEKKLLEHSIISQVCVVGSGESIAAIMIDDFTETLGVNDRVQLAESAAMLRDRINA